VRIPVGSFRPKFERNASLTTTIHEAVVRLGKHSLVRTLVCVEVQRRGDAGRRWGEFKPDFANGLLRAVMSTETNVPHDQWTREYLLPVQILLGDATT
jgi:hypothetical protein